MEKEDLTARRIRAAMKFLLGDPDPTQKDLEHIKKDPDIKSQMKKIMSWRYPGQSLQNSIIALLVGIGGGIVFAVLIIAIMTFSHQ